MKNDSQALKWQNVDAKLKGCSKMSQIASRTWVNNKFEQLSKTKIDKVLPFFSNFYKKNNN